MKPKKGVTIFSLLNATSTPEKAIQFCRERNLLSQEVLCPSCSLKLEPKPSEEDKDGVSFDCENCFTKGSLRKGSWFEKSKLSLKEILMIIYCWSHLLPEDLASNETDQPLETVASCYNCCRDVCAVVNDRQNMRLGGPGRIVEMGETHFATADQIDDTEGGYIVFGGLERGTMNLFAESVEERCPEDYMELIDKYVVPGSIIITPKDDIYLNINHEKYRHVFIDRHKGFLDCKDKDVHIQGLLCLWRRMKLQVKNALPFKSVEELTANMDDFIYRERRRKVSDFFQMFTHHVSEVFPINK